MLALEALAVIVGTLIAAVGLFFAVRTLTTAGKGSFLKERNEELANAYEQVRAQRENERADCQRQIDELTKQVSHLTGVVETLQRQSADVIAAKVLDSFRAAGVLLPVKE